MSLIALFISSIAKYSVETIVFQWIPSHVGIDGNEKADLLAKRGTLEPQDNKALPPESLKNIFFEKLVDTSESVQAEKSTGKHSRHLEKVLSKAP
ncbi:hypothetical protein TNCV_4520491 [Trichonephila clavipes]|nr:hypothetical protein TNCV_4520491 [Trichonephila clavipes]